MRTHFKSNFAYNRSLAYPQEQLLSPGLLGTKPEEASRRAMRTKRLPAQRVVVIGVMTASQRREGLRGIAA